MHYAYMMSNYFSESSNSATTEPTNSGPSVSDGEGNGSSQTEVLAVTDTITTTVTPNSSPISIATDPEMINHSSHTSSAPSATTVIPLVGSTSSASQEPPIAVTDEESALDRRASAPNNTSITIVASVIGGSIFVLLHIVILAIVIYLCYRAKKPGKTNDVTNENQSSEMDQATVGYGSVLYTRATPNLCTNSANADSDRRSYDSSYYTLPIDNIHRVPPVVLDRNPAYGCQEQSEVEDAYESSSINKRLGKVNSYTKILPPTP